LRTRPPSFPTLRHTALPHPGTQHPNKPKAPPLLPNNFPNEILIAAQNPGFDLRLFFFTSVNPGYSKGSPPMKNCWIPMNLCISGCRLARRKADFFSLCLLFYDPRSPPVLAYAPPDAEVTLVLGKKPDSHIPQCPCPAPIPQFFPFPPGPRPTGDGRHRSGRKPNPTKNPSGFCFFFISGV